MVAQNGQNGAPGRDGRDSETDPTALTTQQLEREILHLRELIEARLGQMDVALVEARVTSKEAVEAARISSQTAVSAAIDAAKTAIVEFDSSITRRLVLAQELSDSKFITYRTLLDSNAEKVALALNASNQAVDKAEKFNEKRFDIIGEQINELKRYQDATTGKSAGFGASWGMIIAAIGAVGGLLGILIIVMSMLNGGAQ